MKLLLNIVHLVSKICFIGIVTFSSFTPILESLPWLSMKIKISDTANKPTIATRKSIPSNKCMFPPVKRVNPVELSTPTIAIPRPIHTEIAAFAWLLEPMPPKVQKAKR